MQVEIIGCTCAGKSTLARRMSATATATGTEMVQASELVLATLRLQWIKNRLLRALAIHLIASIGCLLSLRQRATFIRFAYRCSRCMPIPARQRWNQLRKVLKQLGCYEVVIRRRSERTMALLDEGTVHAAHNLFVHLTPCGATSDVEQFAQLVPLPDVLVCLRNREEVLVERLLRRGHARIPQPATREAAARFVRHALETFDLVRMHERLASRTILIDGAEIFPPQGWQENPQIKSVVHLLQHVVDRASLRVPLRSTEATGFQEARLA